MCQHRYDGFAFCGGPRLTMINSRRADSAYAHCVNEFVTHIRRVVQR